MKKTALLSSLLFALILNSGISRADDGGGFLRTIVPDLLVFGVTYEVTDLLSNASYRGGAISNMAINTQDIKSSVTIDGGDVLKLGGTPASVSDTVTQNTTATSAPSGSSNITMTSSSYGSNLSSSTTNTANNVATATTDATQNISAIALANSISATSIGAMNTGNVDINQAIRGKSTYNPSVSNLAINTADIKSSVNLTADDYMSIKNTSISAAAVGAMNTGNITVTAPSIPRH